LKTIYFQYILHNKKTSFFKMSRKIQIRAREETNSFDAEEEDLSQAPKRLRLEDGAVMYELGRKAEVKSSAPSNWGAVPVTVVETKAPPLRDLVDQKNMDEFFVSYEDYKTAPACEAKLDRRSDWYQGAKYRPSDSKRCKEMLVDEELIWRILNSERHVMISGKAGSGKSHLLLRFVKNADTANFTYALTSPTGIAAFNIGGETIHRKLSLGLAADDPVTLFKTISAARKKYSKTWKFLTGTDILIIDEQSMVHRDFFTKLDYLFRKARNSMKPFGGILLILVGDFTQLGPIDKDADRNNPHSQGFFILDSEVFTRMQFSRIILNRSYRQVAGDFLDLLNELRIGQLSDKSQSLLLSRLNADLDLSTTIFIERENGEKKMTKLHLQPMDIYPYKVQVERANREQLKELVENQQVEIHKFYPSLRVQKKEMVPFADPADLGRGEYLMSKDGRKQLEDYFPLFYLELAEGAQVMMRTNKHIDAGVCNGTLGIITAIEPNFVSVLFVVKGKFMEKPMEIERCEFATSVGKTAELVMTQFPLTLAYASTVHKCQGLTLDRLRVDCSSMFASGMLYVALSRARELEHICLLGFKPKSLISDPRAIAFENRQFKE